MNLSNIFNATRTAFVTTTLGLCIGGVNAQSTAPMPMPTDNVKPMPADIVKPMPKAGMDMKPGMERKQGMDIKQGMDMKPMMTDMQDKMMAMKPTGNMDVDFAMMMRVHHQSAITMAEAELQNGKDPQMRAMAKDIIRAQKKEIAAFDKFLAKRGDASMKMGEPGMQMKK